MVGQCGMRTVDASSEKAKAAGGQRQQVLSRTTEDVQFEFFSRLLKTEDSAWPMLIVSSCRVDWVSGWRSASRPRR